MKHKFKVATLLAALFMSANVAQASLISVGTGLVYDNVANVTWSSDANLFATMAAANPNLVNQIIAAVPTVHDTPNTSDSPVANSGNYTLSTGDFNSAGVMTWWGAMAWAKYLGSINYLGHNTWEQPTTYDQTCANYNCTNSMLGELFYTAMGGTAGSSIPASSLFTNVQSSSYWSGTEYTADTYPLAAWRLQTYNGFQSQTYKNGNLYSWVVLPGNAAASAVPEPAGLALFGIGLLGLMVGRRHRRFG